MEAQAALANDPDRSPVGLSRWEMRDWFVPVLFQEPSGDVRLLPEAGLPDAADTELVRRTALGRTPGAPAHGFVGRDRELLALSRVLHRHRVVLLRGSGRLGKTALAAECALAPRRSARAPAGVDFGRDLRIGRSGASGPRQPGRCRLRGEPVRLAGAGPARRRARAA